MFDVQLMEFLLQPLFDIGNIILDTMVAIHRPTMWIILIGISMLELLDLGSKVEIW